MRFGGAFASSRAAAFTQLADVVSGLFLDDNMRSIKNGRGYPRRRTVNAGKRLHHNKLLYYLENFEEGDEKRTHDPNL